MSGCCESLRCTSACALCLDLAILRRRRGDERVDQTLRCSSNLVDSTCEGFLVGPRGLREAADLADVLQRRVTEFLGCCRRLVVEQCVDIAAHMSILRTRI